MEIFTGFLVLQKFDLSFKEMGKLIEFSLNVVNIRPPLFGIFEPSFSE